MPAARESSSSAAAATRPVTGVRSSCATSLENRFSRSADSSSSPSLRDSALGHLVQRAAELRDLVVAGRVEARIEVAGRQATGQGT